MIKRLIIYCSVLTVFSFILLILFQTDLLKNEKVLFFRGLELIFLAIIISMVFFVFVKKIFLISDDILFGALSIAVAVHIIFLIVFPVTFERSLTMFLLSVSAKQEYLTKEEFESLLINDYVKKDGAVNKRLGEQKRIGFFKEESGGFKLTQQGKNFLVFSSFIEKIYGLEK